MAIAVDSKATFDYVLKEDREHPGIAGQTIFKLKPLSAREQARIEDSVSLFDKDGNVLVKTGTKVLDILMVGLVGWENLRDRSGNLIPCPANREERFDLLRPEWRRELADAVTEQSVLSEDERKNSGSGRD